MQWFLTKYGERCRVLIQINSTINFDLAPHWIQNFCKSPQPAGQISEQNSQIKRWWQSWQARQAMDRTNLSLLPFPSSSFAAATAGLRNIHIGVSAVSLLFYLFQINHNSEVGVWLMEWKIFDIVMLILTMSPYIIWSRIWNKNGPSSGNSHEKLK